MPEKILNQMKQIGRYSNIKTGYHEFSKFILQDPSISAAEQTFCYLQRLITRIESEVEHSDSSILREANNNCR